MACGETSDPLISDFDQDALSELSYGDVFRVSKAVVSVVLCQGHSVLFACSGIAIDGCTVVTSAILSDAFDNATKSHNDVVIQIRHEGNVVIGTLLNCDLEHQVAVISIMSPLDSCMFSLDCGIGILSDELQPDIEVIAVGRHVSDKHFVTSGRLASYSAQDGEYVMLSTCKLAEDLQGGALFDLTGYFVGMNLLSYMDGSIFLPKKILIDRFKRLRASPQKTFCEHIKAVRSKERTTAKRGAFESTTFLMECKKVCRGGGETTEPLISDSDQDALSKLSDEVASRLSKTVVSVALCKGIECTVLFSCSGIALDGRTILTSASLSNAFYNARKSQNDVTIEIRHEGNVVLGRLENCDFGHVVAVVSVRYALDCGVCFFDDVEPLPDSEVIAVGRLVSDKLAVAHGIFAAFSAAGGESACKLDKDLQGGALFDLSGNFVGMNLDMDGSAFLPRSILIELLDHLRASRERRTFRELIKAARRRERTTGPPMRSQLGYSLGYPKPSYHMIIRGMILVNSFEETFGDIYPKGVWATFRKKAASNIFRNVVALASFNGETRIFACTGFFIDFDDKCSTILTSASLVRCPDDENEIIEGLKIEVLLPNKQRREGTLQHYSLQYNVALVSVKNFRAVRPAILEHKWINLSSMLVAVGRCYESGILMATRGVLADRTGSLDCEFLDYATCKITKAGIGGPLVDIDGNFIGMNFYDQEIGTAFLLCDDLCGILQYFKTKSEKYEKVDGAWEYIVRDEIDQKNSWPVPKPYWCDPKELEDLRNEKDPMDEYKRLLRASGTQYICEAGAIVVLK